MSTVPFTRHRQSPLPPDLAKQLPSNLDAERSILGAILLDAGAFPRALKAGVKIDDFFLPQNQRIWNAFRETAKKQIAESLEVSFGLVLLTETLHASNDLDRAGGAPYLASLVDGMPRITNVEHYVKIIQEKAARRNLIKGLHQIQEQAFGGETPVADLFADAIQSVDSVEKYFLNGSAKGNRLTAVDFCDLLTMELPPVEYVIDPVIPYRGTTMTFAWRGVGKTYFTMEQAFCVASGVESVFGWPIPKKRKVVYIDGELDSSTLQERAQEIARGHGMQLPERGSLKLIGIDFQETIRPKINSPEGRRQIEEHLEPGAWLILDNWDTLCPSGGEKDQEVCLEMQDWFLDLRKKHITNTFLHHAGKGGEQRGFSGKEDILGGVLKLSEPQDYNRKEGLRAAVTIEKQRGKPKPELMQPFEVTLAASSTGTLQWSMRPLQHLQLQRAFRMFAVDMKPGDVALELGLKNRYVAYRWKKKYLENSDPNAWEAD
jgi:AAA domain/DnaB-like helicase N terminal domain